MRITVNGQNGAEDKNGFGLYPQFPFIGENVMYVGDGIPGSQGHGKEGGNEEEVLED